MVVLQCEQVANHLRFSFPAQVAVGGRGPVREIAQLVYPSARHAGQLPRRLRCPLPAHIHLGLPAVRADIRGADPGRQHKAPHASWHQVIISRLVYRRGDPGPGHSPVNAGHLLQDRWLGDSHRLAVEGQADAGSLTEIVQAGVRRQVACLTNTGPAGEIQVAVVPYRADPGGVRAPAGPDRAKEEAASVALSGRG